MHRRQIERPTTFSAKETKVPLSSLRRTCHVRGTCKQKAEAPWEAVNSSQQSLSFPAVLQGCLRPHEPHHARAPCWVIQHRLGTSSQSSSSQCSVPVLPQHSRLGSRELELLEFRPRTGASYWGKRSFPREITAGWFVIAATTLLQSPSQEVSHDFMCSKEVTPA